MKLNNIGMDFKPTSALREADSLDVSKGGHADDNGKDLSLKSVKVQVYEVKER